MHLHTYVVCWKFANSCTSERDRKKRILGYTGTFYQEEVFTTGSGTRQRRQRNDECEVGTAGTRYMLCQERDTMEASLGG
jgi:hypothetical protein